MTKLEGILRILKRRNFAGKNGIYNVKYHQLNRPIFLVEVDTCKFLGGVGRLTQKKGYGVYRKPKRSKSYWQRSYERY
ncbi:hypothetical protein NEUTE1DRAFT_41142 [Neurospora tetrasperma FGSC 2508]|uniref:Uncharacterized protein n=1 Tax=Neurospora tetrasperma (strain FGSC 2508 / ATCC MYA-4615 / P0657) TaxID=510951 RepID=F8MK91_NEUT8|nr:uncharacterized protein NEUTE1DRAFT_41142 [Neurospora tetrasperma FGSC 2508]EGO57375.1 hypothetical protein NEUTE1DRAFT_41142 [Neurospora tetrasperma FGSC 2508]